MAAWLKLGACHFKLGTACPACCTWWDTDRRFSLQCNVSNISRNVLGLKQAISHWAQHAKRVDLQTTQAAQTASRALDKPTPFTQRMQS